MPVTGIALTVRLICPKIEGLLVEASLSVHIPAVPNKAVILWLTLLGLINVSSNPLSAKSLYRTPSSFSLSLLYVKFAVIPDV